MSTNIGMGQALALAEQIEQARQMGVLRPHRNWIPVRTFLNGWTNFAGGFAVAAFTKDDYGMVYLRGLIKSGTIGQDIFILPSGFNPTSAVALGTTSNDGVNYLASYVRVSTSGAVTAVAGGNSFFMLDGLAFQADS